MAKAGDKTANAEECIPLVSPDRPAANPETDDTLGHAPFARNLARNIARFSPSDGMVLGLYGAWGSGKSTVLNFVEFFLRDSPEESRTAIIRFNPWWFSGQEDLTHVFFDELLAGLRELTAGKKNLREKFERLQKRVDKFANITAELEIPYASRTAKAWKTLRQTTLLKRKEEIESALKGLSSRILVIIDDIDRLTENEIRQMFRLIKAVANFRNVIYLVAFDRRVVAAALKQQQMSGEDYLAKIIQIPFELPLPDRFALRTMFGNRLNELLALTPDELFNSEDMADLYAEGIEHFIETPRDILRLTSSLALTYPAVRSEVNAVDFIVIEAIRIFSPSVYDLVRRNPDIFCDESLKFAVTAEDFREFHASWLKNLGESVQLKREEQGPVKEIMMRLFPRLAAFNTVPNFFSRTRTGRVRPISNVEIFPIYFRLSVPETAVSRAEFLATLQLSEEKLAKNLDDSSKAHRPDGTAKSRAFVELLPDFAGTISADKVPTILNALLIAADPIMGSERFRGSFFPPISWLLNKAVGELLERIPKSDRFQILREAFRKSESVGAMMWLVHTLGQEHGKYGAEKPAAEEPTISIEDLQELEGLAIEKVRAAAKNGNLLEIPNLALVLRDWESCTGLDEVKKWVQESVDDDASLPRLLCAILSAQYVNGKLEYRLDPEWLRSYIEPSSIFGRARKIEADTSLLALQRAAAAQFVREIEIRKRGENPSDPFQR